MPMIGGTDMTEKVERPNYYAIIPASVRYDNNLPGKASLLYGEITALCNQKGYCWASDSYFADLYGVAKSTIQTWLKALEINGHISRDVIYKEGTREIEHRYIRISVGGIPKNQSTPTPKNQRDNNTSINTTVNNTSNKKHSTADAEQFEWKTVIDYLNQKADKHFKHTDANKRLIIARYKDGGFTVDEMKKVIDNQCAKWLNNPEMNQYLRPATLFRASKFEGYLNDQSVDNNKPQTREDWFG
ncbi:hypothetical protein DmLsi_28890 [Lactiplantibacillus plantarum]|nr:hypothetical protein DmLsi_28890 [Lactiplantibacillus plantarum]